MGMRLRAGLIHLAVSCVLVCSVCVLLYFSGYAWPLSYLQGAESILGVLVLVDVCLGPLATLIVSNPAKSRRALLKDWSFIGLIQLLALGFGVNTLWAARPVAVVISEGQAEVVVASQYSVDEFAALHTQCAGYVRPIFVSDWGVCWAVAILPVDGDERQKVIYSAIFKGKDVTAMPKYYADPAAGKNVAGTLQSVSSASKKMPALSGALKQKLTDLGLSEDSVKVLPVIGRQRTMLLIVDPAASKLMGSLID